MVADTDKQTVRTLFDILLLHGVKDAVCSPGSRNAPLLLAAEARPALRKHIVVDERTAAFAALGMAQTTGLPTALICTSGTALLNYAPAVAEAYYRGLPLIVISADRPKEWIDQDDSQTIRQFDSLRNIVKDSCNLSDREDDDTGLWFTNRAVNDMMLKAMAPKRGPVHINIQLDNPLGHTVKVQNSTAQTSTNHTGTGRWNSRVITRIAPASLDRHAVVALAEEVYGTDMLVIAGFHNPDNRLNKAFLKLRRLPRTVVMAETLSNLHLPWPDYVVDPLFSHDNVNNLPHPKLVITTGGALVSRKLKEYLRRLAAENPYFKHWHVGHQSTTVDCFTALTTHIDCNETEFFSDFQGRLHHLERINGNNKKTPSLFAKVWTEARINASNHIVNATLAMPDDYEAHIFHTILKAIPQNADLHLSNGTAVRYAQLFSRTPAHSTWCNRGVSGIEGSTSTAAGSAMVAQRTQILVTGDVSFAHDLGGMAICKSLDIPLKIIVINNAGGGIFRFISTTSGLEAREKYFCADPATDISAVAKAFGFDYIQGDARKLDNQIKKLLSYPGRALLEIASDAERSAAALKQLIG